AGSRSTAPRHPMASSSRGPAYDSHDDPRAERSGQRPRIIAGARAGSDPVSAQFLGSIFGLACLLPTRSQMPLDWTWAGSLGAALLGHGAFGAVVAIALGTLVSEDLTCVTTGLLVRAGLLSYPSGAAACFLGIYVGDLGLWLTGRIAGRRVMAWPWISRR